MRDPNPRDKKMINVGNVPLLLVAALGATWKQQLLSKYAPSVPEVISSLWTFWVVAAGVSACYSRGWMKIGAILVEPSLRVANIPTWLSAGFVAFAGLVASIVQSQMPVAFVMPLVTMTLQLRTWSEEGPDDTELDIEQEVYDQELQTSPTSTKTWLMRSHAALGLSRNFTTVALLLANNESLNGTVVLSSTLTFLGYTAVILYLHHLSQGHSRPGASSDSSNVWKALEKLSLTSLVLSSLLIVLMPPNGFAGGLAFVAADLLIWSAVTSLCVQGFAVTATLVGTLGPAIYFVCTTQNNLHGWTAFCVVVIATWQCIESLSRERHRFLLCLLVLIPLSALIFTKSHAPKQDIATLSSTASTTPDRIIGSSFDYTDIYNSNLHPIESLIMEAQETFSVTLHTQSKSYAQAIEEYRKRYNLEPPRDFDIWYSLARENNFVLIDEFDGLMKTLAPFHGIATSELSALRDAAFELHSDHLLKYEVRNNEVLVFGGGTSDWFRNTVEDWLPRNWNQFLPDVKLIMNVYDEPMVVLPEYELDVTMEHASGPEAAYALLHDQFTPGFRDFGRQEPWEAITLSCPLHSSARQAECLSDPTNTGVNFIQNITQSRDVCQDCRLRNQEGFLFSPENLLLTHSPVPIFSQAKPSTFQDILLPSPWYPQRRREYNESQDMEWNEKQSSLYWAGSATGGYASDAIWQNMQRQRLALLTQSTSNSSIQLLTNDSNHWLPYTTSMSTLTHLFNTRITGTTGQCTPSACTAESAAFSIPSPELLDHPSTAYAHKYLLDMDGNGFSGRFYRLLQSKSVVFKQALFHEWHDDRLYPWVHFVPISTGFEELPEAVRFFATTEEGDRLGKVIAEESKRWAEVALRDVDMHLFWLRLIMEYARLMDEGGG